MEYYEIYFMYGNYEVWKWTNNGQHGERFKGFKTRKSAENWARKQWAKVIWR